MVPANFDTVQRQSVSTISTNQGSIRSIPSSAVESNYTSASNSSIRSSFSSRMSWVKTDIPSDRATEVPSICTTVPPSVCTESEPPHQQSSPSVPTDTTCQTIISSSDFPPPKGRCWCTFDLACKLDGFGKASDWKKHELNMHEPGEYWKCSHSGCQSIFLHAKDFRQHHSEEHSKCSGEYHHAVPLRKKAFACGIEGCKEVFHGPALEKKGSPWYDSRKHIAKHMQDTKATSRWSYSVLVRNLLRQPAVKDTWAEIVGLDYGRNEDLWPTFQWQQYNPDLIKYRLETNVFDNLKDFLFFVYTSADKVFVVTAATSQGSNTATGLNDQPVSKRGSKKLHKNSQQVDQPSLDALRLANVSLAHGTQPPFGILSANAAQTSENRKSNASSASSSSRSKKRHSKRSSTPGKDEEDQRGLIDEFNRVDANDGGHVLSQFYHSAYAGDPIPTASSGSKPLPPPPKTPKRTKSMFNIKNMSKPNLVETYDPTTSSSGLSGQNYNASNPAYDHSHFFAASRDASPNYTNHATAVNAPSTLDGTTLDPAMLSQYPTDGTLDFPDNGAGAGYDFTNPENNSIDEFLEWLSEDLVHRAANNDTNVAVDCETWNTPYNAF